MSSLRSLPVTSPTSAFPAVSSLGGGTSGVVLLTSSLWIGSSLDAMLTGEEMGFEMFQLDLILWWTKRSSFIDCIYRFQRNSQHSHVESHFHFWKFFAIYSGCSFTLFSLFELDII